MSEYSQEIMKAVVAKICQTIGWHSIQTTPLEIMVDVLRRYLLEITKLTSSYATLYGHTQPNLDELGLAFRDLHINIADLEEYVRCVDSSPPIEVPKYPVHKESHLNFLKPGSGEVVTRPVHIYEHLPPMFKIAEEAETTAQQMNPEEISQITASDTPTTPVTVFKRPADISPNEPIAKRTRLILEEEGRPTREISSVMMTTSGFLSPAREGKLPEARTPITAMEITPSTSIMSSSNNTNGNINNSINNHNSNVNNTSNNNNSNNNNNNSSSSSSSGSNNNNNNNNHNNNNNNNNNNNINNNGAYKDSRPEKKIPKVVREQKKIEKRKEKISKELIHKGLHDDIPMKKVSPMKDLARMKAMKSNHANHTNVNVNSVLPSSASTPKLSGTKSFLKHPNKAQMKQMSKSEKQPAPCSSNPLPQKILQEDRIIDGKLTAEPDKSKLNIFKKISKVKDEKIEKAEKVKVKEEPPEQESRGSSPDLVIDEPELKSSSWDHPKGASHKSVVETGPDNMSDKHGRLSANNDKYYDVMKNSPHSEKDFLYDDDISPPGTPSTPKTPEMPLHSPPMKPEKEGKRKRKDKTPKVKNKSAKVQRYMMSPRRNKTNDTFESELERPKTPNDPINMMIKDEPVPPPLPMQPIFQYFHGLIPSAPGLIPPPMTNPLFPRLPIAASLPKHGFGQPAHMPPAMPLSFLPPQPSLNHPLPVQLPLPKQQPPPILDPPVVERNPRVQESPPELPIKKQEQSDSSISSVKEKHKKDKKDKPKKKNKKDKIKNKSEKRKLKEEKKEKDNKKKKEKKKDKEREQHEGSVPKLTLKIGSPRPLTPDVPPTARKLMIKPVLKKEEDIPSGSGDNSSPRHETREPSPELARISALVTRPPKIKATTKQVTESVSSSHYPTDQPPIPSFHAKLKKNMFRAVPKIKSRDRKQKSLADADVNDLFSTSCNTDASHNEQIPAPVLAAPTAFYIDNNGIKVWICPACNGQDDGSPMIGCDDCDAWYHWVCVGIQVPPDDNENWYCRICLVKKQETIQMDKKKKRKKKEKKDH